MWGEFRVLPLTDFELERLSFEPRLYMRLTLFGADEREVGRHRLITYVLQLNQCIQIELDLDYSYKHGLKVRKLSDEVLPPTSSAVKRPYGFGGERDAAAHRYTLEFNKGRIEAVAHDFTLATIREYPYLDDDASSHRTPASHR
jgi:hypothetical protein